MKIKSKTEIPFGSPDFTRKAVIKITIKDVKDVLEVGAKVADAVDKTIKLIDKLRK